VQGKQERVNENNLQMPSSKFHFLSKLTAVTLKENSTAAANELKLDRHSAEIKLVSCLKDKIHHGKVTTTFILCCAGL
jgi:hypothetical protein